MSIEELVEALKQEIPVEEQIELIRSANIEEGLKAEMVTRLELFYQTIAEFEVSNRSENKVYYNACLNVIGTATANYDIKEMNIKHISDRDVGHVFTLTCIDEDTILSFIVSENGNFSVVQDMEFIDIDEFDFDHDLETLMNLLRADDRKMRMDLIRQVFYIDNVSG